ncbi:MAG: porin family protein [Ignavibacteria bacterium]
MNNTMYSKKNLLKVLIYFTIISAPGISHAQKLSYGIKGGLNISETLNTYYESDSKTGFNVYAFGDYDFNKNFTIGLEAGYTRKGFKTKPYDYYYDKVHYYGTTIANLNYFDISVSGKFKSTNGKIIPYISAGPSLGIKVNTSVKGNSDEYAIADVRNFLNLVYTNSFGIKLGVGTEIYFIKNMSIIFETKYNFDLISSLNAPDVRLGIETWQYSDNVKNNVFEFSAGVKF